MTKEKKSQKPTESAAPKGTRTEQRKVERQSERRRQRITIGAIAAGAVVLLSAILLIIGNTPAEAPIPAESIARYEGLTQNVSDKGYPRIGNLDGINVVLFNALSCDTCNIFHKDVLPQLIDRVREGEILLHYAPIGSGAIPNVNGATRSALCVANQGKFFEYADALMQWQDDYGRNAFADNRLTSGASALNLNMDAFHGCRRGAPEGVVFERSAIDLGDSKNNTLPIVFVNHVAVTTIEGDLSVAIEDINRAIDDAIDFRSGFQESTPAPEVTAEPTAELTAEPTTAPESTTEPEAEATAEATGTGS